jgi:hypothetical protein
MGITQLEAPFRIVFISNLPFDMVAVMGSGDIVVGNPTPNQSTPSDPGESAARPRPRQQQMCGAMTEQGDGNRAPSQPQEFIRLVGYRDPRVRPPRAPR